MQPLFGFFPKKKKSRLTSAQRREQNSAMDERDAFLAEKARLKEQGIDLDAPQEPLACPRCKEVYDFGAECPECMVELVGVSMVDDATPVAVQLTDRSWIFIYALPGVLAVAAGIGIWWVVHTTGG